MVCSLLYQKLVASILKKVETAFDKTDEIVRGIKTALITPVKIY